MHEKEGVEMIYRRESSETRGDEAREARERTVRRKNTKAI